MKERIKNKVADLRDFYYSGKTMSIDFRLEQLKKFKTAIKNNETEILDALWLDLRKSPEEAYLTEISIVLGEIDLHIKKLEAWAKPKKVSTPLHLFPSKSYICYEPLGLSLIIAPWNYPFQLLLNPLIGAISAGCTAMLKTSPAAPATAQIVEKIVSQAFDPAYINIEHGRRDVNAALLEEKYDFIFFTGSPQLGKIVYKSAAENLTPVILELGGKSPCIVDKDADIKVSARRIIWGKLINAGQTCIAPDYLYVHNSVAEDLLRELKNECEKMYGKDVSDSRFYPRIVNENAWDRIVGLMSGENRFVLGVPEGADNDKGDLFIAPTILLGVTPDSAVMQEEIFGPVLPMMTFDDLSEVYTYVNNNEKPLALYYFGKSDEEVILNTSSGGACINDTIMHIANHNLPFGGVGNSGLGKYHGHNSFTLFSNQRAVIKTPTWLDLPLKYPPFKYFKYIRHIL